MDDRVPQFFIGRENEIQQLTGIINVDSKVRILNIHSNGDGGIGKTQLLRKAQEMCKSSQDNVFYNQELIDFYHTEARSRIGIMQQIVNNLDRAYFEEFGELALNYHQEKDFSRRERVLFKLEEAFKNGYANFSGTLKEKVIVLFIDTYECIQRISMIPEKKQVENTGLSRWIETNLFPSLFECTQNTRLVVSGRYPLKEIDRSGLSIKEIILPPFESPDTLEFLQKCVDAKTLDELTKKSGSKSMLDTIQALSGGRPILLALFADWVNYKDKPLSPQELIADVEKRTGKITILVTDQQRELFEETLIERIQSLVAPEDRAVVCMAVAYHRMTPEMLHFLNVSLSLKECRDVLLKKLNCLSFIKYKPKETVLLHDEMRRLVIDWFNKHQDPSRAFRRDIASDLVNYYENLLNTPSISEAERGIYTSELLEYAFLADPQNGLNRFRQTFENDFDIAIEDGSYDYCDMLLRDAELYQRENPQDIPFPYFLEIELRRIQYNNEIGEDYEGSCRIADKILEDYAENPTWKKNALSAHFLMQKGIAEFWLERFEEAIVSFQQAKDGFLLLGEDDTLAWVYNWIGYVYYRQGKFVEAEDYLNRARIKFHKLIDEPRKRTERERRRLYQGIQLVLGNLAMVYTHKGLFGEALRYAEITLEIVRELQHNTREIARARVTTGSIFALAGHAIDARHHLENAEILLQEIYSPLIEGRVKIELGFLESRVEEPGSLFEYYRAEEIEQLITERRDGEKKKRAEKAKNLINAAIEHLKTPTVFKKELGDAYYHFGNLALIMPSENHWQQAEEAYRKSLQCGADSKFLYREISTLESLVSLYYFWNGTSEAPERVKKQNQEKMKAYQETLESYRKLQLYPNLFGRYEVTLGDIEFDHAIASLHAEQEERFNLGTNHLKQAFQHYLSAISLMETFHKKQYYIALRVFYNRLNTLINKVEQKDVSSSIMGRLVELTSVWAAKSEDFEKICNYIFLRIQPQSKTDKINHLKEELQSVVSKENYAWALLLNDCLIQVYKSLTAFNPKSNEYQEQLILQLIAQCRYYRMEGDEYQAQKCIQSARKQIEFVSDSDLQQGLEGYTDSAEGTLEYRRGEHGKLLEFYLSDQLDIACAKFDGQYPESRDRALRLLKASEEKLQKAIESWEKKSVPDLVQRFSQYLADARFRLGELLGLYKQFGDDGEQQGSLDYLKQAIRGFDKKDPYRYDYAVQSYISALYFAGQYNHPDYLKERQKYENQFEKRSQDLDQTFHPSIMGRLRITQGDALFSESFKRKESDDIRSKYISPKKVDIATIRTIVKYYVQACNFMAQQSPAHFAVAFRVLQRRIELLGDQGIVQEMIKVLPDLWADQRYLKDRTDKELAILIQFAQVRNMILEDKSNSGLSQ